MRDPHVRFCERRGGVIPRAYSTVRKLGLISRGERGASVDRNRLEDWMDVLVKGSAHCPAAMSPITR